MRIMTSISVCPIRITDKLTIQVSVQSRFYSLTSLLPCYLLGLAQLVVKDPFGEWKL